MFFAYLASVLAAGGLASLLLVSPADFGKGFHRFGGVNACFLLAAGLAGGSLRGFLGVSSLVACLLWVGVTQWGPLPWFRPTLALPVVLSGAALATATTYAPRFPSLELGSWMVPGNTFAASLLIGSVTLAMLLGHWYLIIPGLPLRHLRRLTLFLGACLALRVVLGGASLTFSSPLPALGNSSGWGVVAGPAAFLFWQRVGIGLVAPIILAILVDRTVRIGSTQSATGLLYVAVIFVLIGELLSRYLYVTMGIPA